MRLVLWRNGLPTACDTCLHPQWALAPDPLACCSCTWDSSGGWSESLLPCTHMQWSAWLWLQTGPDWLLCPFGEWTSRSRFSLSLSNLAFQRSKIINLLKEWRLILLWMKNKQLEDLGRRWHNFTLFSQVLLKFSHTQRSWENFSVVFV